MMNQNKIAIICNYLLLPDRVGGMDKFFWLFDQSAKDRSFFTQWFFPNPGVHGNYKSMDITAIEGQAPEKTFLQTMENQVVKYDYVITHFVELATPFYRKVAMLTGAKIIAVDHNPRPSIGYNWKKRIEKKMKGLLFGSYIDIYVSVSEAARHMLVKDFGKIGNSRSVVIPNGIDMQEFIRKEGCNTPPKFLVSSHLRREKGVQDLITAVAELHKAMNIYARIDVYGEGPMAEELKSTVLNEGLGDFVIFKGTKSSMHHTYSQYDFLIHPSYGETFCYSVLESLVCNVPVITTNQQGNILNLVSPGINGFLYDAGDTAALMRILKDILLHNCKVDDFRNSSDITKYTIEKMVDKYLDLVIAKSQVLN